MVLRKKTSIALIAILSLTVMFFPGIKGISEIENFKPKDQKNFLNGQYIKSINAVFEDKNPIQSIAISFWSRIKYTFFKEGSPGVLIGNDNWLFSTEEFDENLVPQISYNDFFDQIERASKKLKEDSLSLIIALVPSKNRILREKISRYKPSNAIVARYDDVLKHLRTMNLSVIDLREPLKGLPKKTPPFYQFDTHWTGKATEVAAAAIAAEINPLIQKNYRDRRSYQISKKENFNFQGDLLAFVPPLKNHIENYEELTLVDSNPPQLGLFDDPEIPVILVGTSYSANPKWNCEKNLKLALQLDVLNMAKEGKGPLEPMEELLESAYYRETGSKIVIWEIPERYIPLRKN